jgi:hypothetical protein
MSPSAGASRTSKLYSLPAPPPLTDPEVAHLCKAGKLLMDFKRIKGREPNSPAELRTWAVRAGKAKDETFISTRDGYPYDFLIGGPDGLTLAESVGKEDWRFVYEPSTGRAIASDAPW